LIMVTMRAMKCLQEHLRSLPKKKLMVACTIMPLLTAYAMWSCYVGPAVHELRTYQSQLDVHLVEQSTTQKLRTQLTVIQADVRRLRREADEVSARITRLSDSNGCFSYFESLAANSGVRLRLFETESRGSIQPGGGGFSRVLLEGPFPRILSFSEAASTAPTTLRLDTFVADRTEETLDSISLSITVSADVGAPELHQSCDVNF